MEMKRISSSEGSALAGEPAQNIFARHLTSSFFIFLASLGPLLLGVAAEAAEVGELGLLLSLTLLACDAEPGLRAEDDLSRGDSEVRCKEQ